MFGKTINRYCSNCKQSIECKVPTGFNIGGKNYYNVCVCPICKTDLAVEDKRIIEKAKSDGTHVGKIMY